jgi:hypothetical protein
MLQSVPVRNANGGGSLGSRYSCLLGSIPLPVDPHPKETIPYVPTDLEIGPKIVKYLAGPDIPAKYW